MNNKNEVYVKVDTPKKAKKLKKTLDMFGEPHTGSAIGNIHYNGAKIFDDTWCAIIIEKELENETEVSIKELKNILAVEHLKEGDVALFECDGQRLLGKFVEYCDEFRFEVTDLITNNAYKEGCFDNFIRYATEEEKQLLNPKKDLEVGKWYLFNGHCTENKPLMLVSSNHNDRVYFCGFNFLNQWVDEDFYTTDDLNKYGYREATPQEVEKALIEEAKRRGFKVGFIAHVKHTDGRETFWNGKDPERYVFEDNTLYYYSHLYPIFKDGQWATIIEKDKFAEIKEAHRNGAVIECLQVTGEWYPIENPKWDTKSEYRIKPQQTFTDKDVAIIERLHDTLVDNHKYSLESELLTEARMLADKIKGAI